MTTMDRDDRMCMEGCVKHKHTVCTGREHRMETCQGLWSLEQVVSFSLHFLYKRGLSTALALRKCTYF